MCLMPRFRSPSMISRASGRCDADELDGSTQVVVDRHEHQRVPLVVRLVQGVFDRHGGISISSNFMKRALPTRTVWPSMPTVMP